MQGKLGDYILEAEIGRGGMGRVYRARHARTGAIRAVKTLEQAGDVESILRFRREAEALARVGGAVAVPIHESGTEQGRFFFVMDLMPGGSLRERSPAGVRLPWRDAVALGVQLARALAALHDHGLVHRDLKPANILFAQDGSPRLADLGCVRELSSSSLTASGTIMGTLAYMAPEQLKGDRAGPPADVFALGVIVHELISGGPLFAGAPLRQLQLRAGIGKRRRLEGLGQAPRALDEVLDRVLAVEEKERPSARELAALLEGAATARGALVPARVLPIGGAALLVVGLVALVRLRGAPAPVAPDPAETPTASPRAPGPTASPLTNLERIKRRLNDPAPITSGDVTLADVAELANAGDGVLLTSVADHRGLFDLDGLANLKTKHSTMRPLARLYAYAALATGGHHKAAIDRLRLAGGTEADLGPLIARVDRTLEWVSAPMGGEYAGGISSQELEGLARQLPRDSFLALVAPFEPLCRAHSLVALRGRLRGEPLTPMASVVMGLLRPCFDQLPGALQVELAIEMREVRKLAHRNLSVNSERVTLGASVIDLEWASKANVLGTVPELRLDAQRFDEAAKGFERTEPVLAIGARATSIECRILADSFADSLSDTRVEGEGESELARLEPRLTKSGDDEELLTPIAHDLHDALAQRYCERALSVPPGPARVAAARKAKEHANAALALWPVALTEQSAIDARALDAHLVLRAQLTETTSAVKLSPSLGSLIRAEDWLRLELLRREGKPDAVIAEVQEREERSRQVFMKPEDRVAEMAMRALCCLQLGTPEQVARAEGEIDNLQVAAAYLFELPDLKLSALRARLAKAMKRK